MQLVGLLWDPGVLGVVARAGPCSFRQLTHSLGKPAQRTPALEFIGSRAIFHYPADGRSRRGWSRLRAQCSNVTRCLHNDHNSTYAKRLSRLDNRLGS